MNELLGNKTAYILVQKESEQDTIQPVLYTEYQGGFNVTDLNNATRFDDKEDALQLAQLQNQIGAILKSRFSYEVVEENIERKVISEIVEEEATETE